MATVFEKSEGEHRHKLSIVLGPGKYDFLIKGFCEIQPLVMQVSCDGCRENKTVMVYIDGVHMLTGNNELEIWGKLQEEKKSHLRVDGWEKFHGEYTPSGSGNTRGWLEHFDAWTERATMLACPNVDLLPNVTIHFNRADGPKVEPERSWRQIGFAQRPCPSCNDIRLAHWEFFKLYRTLEGELVAIADGYTSPNHRDVHDRGWCSVERGPKDPMRHV